MNAQPSWVCRLAEWWRDHRRRIDTAKIFCDASGIVVTVAFRDGSTQRLRLLWKDVNGVVAYKRDFITVDEICLGFSSPDGAIEVNERMEGWQALIDALPTYLPGVPSREQWWPGVAQAPFAANATKLYPRQ